MSLQDDIFDVQAALDGKPDAEAFDRIYTRLAGLERKVEVYAKLFADIRAGAQALNYIFGENDEKRRRK